MAKAAKKEHNYNNKFITVDGLNAHERKILGLLEDGIPMTINEMKVHFNQEAYALCAKHPNHKSGDGQPELRRNSIVRNSLRKLFQYDWVDQVNRGMYMITDTATRRLRRAQKQSYNVAKKAATAAAAGKKKKATKKAPTKKA